MRCTAILACCWLLLPTPSATEAATLQVVGGQLVGASDVDVGGTLYDVAFLDGTCIEFFDGCDEASDFGFQTLASALAASQALLDQVFLDDVSGSFDSSPELTEGCISTQNCVVFTPYGLSANVDTAAALNYSLASGVADFTEAAPIGADTMFQYSMNGVLARWTVVPEPSTAPLLALGIAALALGRRGA